MMKERTLRVLEFTKILDMLASFAVTDMGREACEKLTPLSDLAQVNEALEETEEAQVILTYLGDSPLIGFPDVRPYLTLAAKGAALNPKALLSVAECLRLLNRLEKVAPQAYAQWENALLQGDR